MTVEVLVKNVHLTYETYIQTYRGEAHFVHGVTLKNILYQDMVILYDYHQ